MYTNALFCGLLTIQDDPDSVSNPGALNTTGSVKANTFVTAASYIKAGDYLMSNTYIQAPYCNLTSTTQTNIFSGPLSLAATSSLTSAAAAQFTNLTTTSATVANTFAGPVNVQNAITGASTLSITNQITCANINTGNNIFSNTFAGLVLTSSGLVCNSSIDANTAGTGIVSAQAGALTNIGGFSNYLSVMIGGRLTVASVGSSVMSNYPALNSSVGVFFHCNGQTWNDATTATSATANGNFYGSYFGAPLLTATKTSVSTSIASTVLIAGAPSAGTNQSITSPYALYIQSGNVLFAGTADANLSNSAIAALNVSGGLTVTKSISATNIMMTGYSAIYNLATGTNGSALTIAYQMTPNMISGSRTEAVMGQALSVNNTGIFNFNYVASGSTSNTFGFGLFGSNNRLTINGAGQVSVVTSTNATSPTNGAFTIAGGGGVVKDWYVGGTQYTNQLNITSTVNSTSTTSGAIIAQSAGFAQDVYANQLHSIQQYFLTGYVNSNQTIAAITLNASSSSAFANSLVSGNGTTVTFTAPNRAKYTINLILLGTPNYAGKIQGWIQINSPVLYNGTLRRGYINRSVTANTQETIQVSYLGPLNAGDTVTFYLLYNPTALLAVNPSISIASSTFSSLDISTNLLND